MQNVQHKGLLWAQQLRAEILERSSVLRAALADIEPLREELSRLEAQLRGVDRLIAIQSELLGQPTSAERTDMQTVTPRTGEIFGEASSLPVWLSPAPPPEVHEPTWHGLLLGEVRGALKNCWTSAGRLFAQYRAWLRVRPGSRSSFLP